MHWLTPSVLKSCLCKLAFKTQKFGVPPPLAIASSSNSTSETSDLKLKSKPPGRPINISQKDLKGKENKHYIAKKKIT